MKTSQVSFFSLIKYSTMLVADAGDDYQLLSRQTQTIKKLQLG